MSRADTTMKETIANEILTALHESSYDAAGFAGDPRLALG